MKAVLQRVKEAAVVANGMAARRIGRGLLVFLCVERGDTETEADYFARKIAAMRLFGDGEGRINLSLLDIGGAALVVSQFTLAALWRKGNRPSFSGAADAETGRRLYESFCERLRSRKVPVKTGVFGATMAVSLINDGPLTIWMDSADG
ncbi:MAG: D-aminoacyl-tRNA deacylase [Rhodospirillales bacterium]|jgi:D-tyrosyl-tRNA(Tyr) deacylase|nr:D-aminoacyl-tRNA deacylase [Rhodospirillales bacterium]HIJ43643.1 D-tyrosyl-tRNA(Tyr) deacylase [Rhodospirillaceae bacterium]HIJ46132.1 D-tyrosyl-tRNA(Tyr) deacylase [Rhodospirillaceae bacterium]HIJ92243.1 D-tyrosyl-tRNA(Tyr) deacylase [Rhodospirillaceae bacterium]HJP54360.1 D-aminoacyl-tRNA deacylase [Rhodospirillales bacterium]